MKRWIYALSLVLMGCGASHEVGKGAAQGALTGVKEESQNRDGGPPPLESASGNIVSGALTELDKPDHRAAIARIFAAATQGAVTSAVGGGPEGAPIATSTAPTTPGVAAGASASGRARSGGPSTVRRVSAGGGPMAALGGSLSTGFTQGLSRQLEAEIGPNGDGPLGKTLSALAQQMSGAAADGVAQSFSAQQGDCTEADKTQCTQRRVEELSRTIGAGVAQGFASALRLPIVIAAFLGGVLATIIAFAFVRLSRRPA